MTANKMSVDFYFDMEMTITFSIVVSYLNKEIINKKDNTIIKLEDKIVTIKDVYITEPILDVLNFDYYEESKPYLSTFIITEGRYFYRSSYEKECIINPGYHHIQYYCEIGRQQTNILYPDNTSCTSILLRTN